MTVAIRRICVFCGSRPGARPEYLACARATGRALAERGIGLVYGGLAGYSGGRTDNVMMRFADFVIALPFLLFMILFKIAFGIGPGESGIFPMLIALVLLFSTVDRYVISILVDDVKADLGLTQPGA